MAGVVFRGVEMPPEMEGGIKDSPPMGRPAPAPEMDIIGYAGKGGQEFFGLSVLGFRQSAGLDGRWEAKVYHPINGIEGWTERSNRVSSLTPVRVVLREKYDSDMAAMQKSLDEMSVQMKELGERLKVLEGIVAGPV